MPDPGAHALAADLEGVLSFKAHAPRFEGAVMLATPANLKPNPGGESQTPWKISAKVKADPAGAQFEQVEASYGVEDRALKFVGLADAGFGATPLLHATLSARQLDADRFVARNNDKDNDKKNDKDKTCGMIGEMNEHNNPETAALVVVANAMMNMDELITKN